MSTLVYELRDAAGTVIYVGATTSLEEAFAKLAESDWWAEVDPGQTTATSYDDPVAANAHARALLSRLAPRHNFMPDESTADGRAAVQALTAFAEEQRRAPQRRLELVDAARQAGVTWRDIAAALEMTEEGLRKAVRRR